MPMFFDGFTRFGAKNAQHAHHPWTLQHLVDEMRHCSISGALVASTAQVVYDPMTENLRLLEKLKPFDFLFPIWNAMPHWSGEFPEPPEFIRLMKQHNVRAVSLHPGANAWRLMASSSEALLDELERNRILTIFDAANDLTDIDMEQLAERHPNLPILMRGLWWSRQRYAYPVIRRHKNVHVGFDMFQVNYGIEWLVEQGCEDQLVFCSNAPEMSAGAHRCYIDYADVPEATRAKIASGNLIRLLAGLKPPREIVNANEDPIMAAARLGEPVPMEAIDIHAHILDEGLHGAGGAGYTMHRGGPAGTLKLASRMGVKAIGLMSWNGTVGAHADDGNACVKAALDALPEGWWGLISCDPMHETREQTRAKLEQWFEDDRFLGLKPYPSYGKHYDDPAYEVWWEFGNERRLYAGLHPNRGDLSEFDALCPKYPDMTFVAYHCGQSYATADHAIARAKKYPNFMIEITLTPVCGGIIDYLVKGAGVERVMYGSDLPMRDPRQQFGWCVYSKLPLEQKKLVLGGNAKRLIEAIRAFQKTRRADRPTPELARSAS